MNEILIVTAIVGGMGAILGFILALASQLFYVETDPRYDLILENLPNINCGACGYPGCAGMTTGLLAGEADVKQCKPGSAMTYARVRAIMAGLDPDTATVEAPAAKPAKAAKPVAN
jgi:electron transport complex protein RnfB